MKIFYESWWIIPLENLKYTKAEEYCPRAIIIGEDFKIRGFEDRYNGALLSFVIVIWGIRMLERD